MSFFAPRTATLNKTDKNDKAELLKKNQPWVEKYRPKTMDDISSQEQAVLVLKKALQSENLPHLLFYGPPGTGKTSTILALANELYGPKLIKSRILELNASDERGIQIIRDKVKNFSRTTVTNKVEGYPCPAYKIVILDEADSMTRDAQSALRRIMETYSKTTRFCLICNYVSRIIEPITSRCAKFRFKSLPVADLEERLQMICEREGVNLAANTLKTLIECSGGDLRKAITFLQSGYNLQGKNPITPRMINEMAGIIPEESMNELINIWMNHDDVKEIQRKVQNIMNEGYSGENIMNQIHDAIIKNDSLNTLQKAKISQYMATVDIDLIQGADEHLQVLNLMVHIAEIAAI
ncbi:replication factor C subunit 2 [Cokeromyces recurvatus]|uniref:replication factor C subunit 2 n=1 Tax=Cokeromyces recurvatus TaxID=90255 RepID=UPI00221ED278|nr:replication factor C subunit 2 [Cokeromyces recurvatus]KAI7900699.1 replication factor C subunit 2 [Cokeromyces recurvatus]